MAEYQYLDDARSDGVKFPRSSSALLGLWGVAPVAQPAASAYAAVATTAGINSSISSSCFGFTSAQCAAIITLVNGMRAMGVTAGVWST